MKTIHLKKQDAINFFGSAAAISKLLRRDPSLISRWEDYVPDGPAWALWHISKKPKYRKNKLAVVINV